MECGGTDDVSGPLHILAGVNSDIDRLAGASISVKAANCSSDVGVTDGEGFVVDAPFPTATPFYLVFTHPDHLPAVSPEYLINFGSQSGFQEHWRIFPTAGFGATAFPDYAADKAHAYLTIAGGCMTVGGYTLSIDDHPEAVVTYWDDNGPNPALTSAPANNGRISVSNINPGVPATLTSDNGVCALQLYFAPEAFTTNLTIPLEPGAVYVGTLLSSPI
jgi:hypothetical protein